MRVKGIVMEDFVNYKRPSMFINTCFCDFKCCTEQDLDRGVCQNAPLAQANIQEIPDETILRRFQENPITKAVVIGGMEPFLQTDELVTLLKTFRTAGEMAPFIVYTGYYPEEIPERLDRIAPYGNLIVKFGRYNPRLKDRYDEVLGVRLASENQFARVIS